MTVVEHYGSDEQLLARTMALCNDANLNDANQAEGEPTEAALVNYAYKLGCSKKEMENETPRVGEAPFDSARKLMTTVHDSINGKFMQYTKGARDVLVSRCTTYWDGSSQQPMTDKKG